MLSRSEINAICLAASTAPIVNCLAFGSMQQFVFVAGVAYVAAFLFGAPGYVYLRYRGWRLVSRSLLSGAAAGALAAILLVTLVFVGFPPRDFFADPWPALSLVAIGLGWGIGLGLVAGATLFALVSRHVVPVLGA